MRKKYGIKVSNFFRFEVLSLRFYIKFSKKTYFEISYIKTLMVLKILAGMHGDHLENLMLKI